MTNEEKVLDLQTKPDPILDQVLTEKITDEDLVRDGLLEVDSDKLATELISNGGSDLDEIVENAVAGFSADYQVELALSYEMDLREGLSPFTVKSDDANCSLNKNGLPIEVQVNCVMCREGIMDGLEQEVKVHTEFGAVKGIISVWACNNCTSTKTYRDFEVHFLQSQLPYRIVVPEEKLPT